MEDNKIWKRERTKITKLIQMILKYYSVEGSQIEAIREEKESSFFQPNFMNDIIDSLKKRFLIFFVYIFNFFLKKFNSK